MADPEPNEAYEADQDGLAAAAPGPAGTEDDDVEADWSPAASDSVRQPDADDLADGPGAQEPSSRVLNQDEIDSLLSLPDSGAGAHKSGMAVLIDNSTVSYERLPMLEVVFDRLVRIMTTSLRNFTSENVEVTLDLRLPYMQIAPQRYVTNHASNRRSLDVRAGATR